MTDEAGWRSSLVSTADFLANTPPAERAPLVECSGWELDMNMNDPMHGLNLGCDQHVAGNCLYDAALEATEFKTQQRAHLERVWHAFKAWCRARRKPCSIALFTPANINKDRKRNYPLLHAKAANTRVLLSFLAGTTLEASEAAPTDHYKRMRAVCVWAIADFHYAMEDNGAVLSDSARDRLVRVGWIFLRTYAALNRHAVDRGERAWHLVPKFHFFAHTLLDIARNSSNPRFSHCFADEDMVGRVARGTRLLHRSTVSERYLERYINMLVIRWKRSKIECCWW